MNVNSIEMLSLDKKFNYGLMAKETPVDTTTATKPENIMNAMDLQSRNNIAFQGKTSFAKNLGKKILPLAIGALTLGGITSCLNVRQDVNVNLTELTDAINQLVELQKEGNTQNDSILSYLVVLANNSENANEFYETAVKYMMNDEQLSIIRNNALNNLNMTAEDVDQRIAHIEELMAEGNFAEAYAEMIALLGSIDFHVAHLDSLFTEYYTQWQNQKAQLEADQAANYAIWAQILNENTATRENTDSLSVISNNIAADVKKLEETTRNINIAIGDNGDKLDSIQANQKEQMNIYTANEAAKMSVLNEINNKLNFAGSFPGADQTALMAKLDVIVSAIQNHRDLTIAELNELNAKADEILEAIKANGTKIDGISNKITTYNNTYNSAMEGFVDDLKSVITNGFNAVDTRLAVAEANMNLVVNYSEQLKETTDTISAKMDQNKPLTAAEVDSILTKQGYANLLNSLHLDLDLTNMTIGEATDSIASAIEYQQQHLQIMIEIRDLLKAHKDELPAKWTEVLAKLDALVDCCKSCNSKETNEGTQDDLGDLFN